MSRNYLHNVKMSQICRVCLRSDDTLRPASESTIPKFDAPPIAVIELWQLFTETLTTQEAGFPDKLCSNCFHELQNAYLFMLKCEKADAILKQIKQIHFHLNTHYNGINNNNDRQTYVKHSAKDEDEISTDLDIKDELSSNDFDIDIDDEDESCSDSNDLDIEIKDEEQTNDSYTSNIDLNIRRKDPNVNLENTPMNVDTTTNINELKYNRFTTHPAPVEIAKRTNDCMIRTYKCPRCSYTCIHSSNLHRHIFRRHVENIAEEDDEEEMNSELIRRSVDRENNIIIIDSELLLSTSVFDCIPIFQR